MDTIATMQTMVVTKQAAAWTSNQGVHMAERLKRWIADTWCGVSGLDQLFGLKSGMSLHELSALTPLVPVPGAQGLYCTMQLPQAWPEFERYVLEISPIHGLCKIVAHTPTLYSDASGKCLRGCFDGVAARINRRANSSQRYDVYQSGSVFADPDLWMVALRLGDAALAELWTGSDLAGVGGVQAAALRVKSVDTYRGALELMLELDNFQAHVADADVVSGGRARVASAVHECPAL
jgi:hypothetical protein